MLDVDSQLLSRTIGAIYDCALDPQLWPTALEKIAGLIGGNHAALRAVNPITADLRLNITWGGGGPHWKQLYDETYFKLVPTFRPQLEMGVDEPSTSDAFMPRAEFVQSRFYKEWAKPQDFFDVAGVAFLRRPDLRAHVSVYTPSTRARVGPRDVAIMTELSPHIRRAIVISDLLEMKTIAAETVHGALDLLGVAILLVDAECRLVHANRAGEALLRMGSPFINDKARIRTADPKTSAVLADAVARANRDDVGMGRAGIGLPVGGDGAARSVIHVLPLARREHHPRLASSAVAALFVAPTTAGPHVWRDAVAALYDLTPAETRVLALLAQGLAPADISTRLAVSQPTVRTHLQRLYSKTGTERQGELIALVASLSLPLAG
jgi:DNA-binding CsgD family transcriptional regulator